MALIPGFRLRHVDACRTTGRILEIRHRTNKDTSVVIFIVVIPRLGINCRGTARIDVDIGVLHLDNHKSAEKTAATRILIRCRCGYGEFDGTVRKRRDVENAGDLIGVLVHVQFRPTVGGAENGIPSREIDTGRDGTLVGSEEAEFVTLGRVKAHHPGTDAGRLSGIIKSRVDAIDDGRVLGAGGLKIRGIAAVHRYPRPFVTAGRRHQKKADSRRRPRRILEILIKRGLAGSIERTGIPTGRQGDGCRIDLDRRRMRGGNHTKGKKSAHGKSD